MDLSKVTIRAMRDGEQKEMQQIGKRAFQFVEALFVGRPQKAMAAEYEGRLVGGILYKKFTVRQKRNAYIDEAFVDPDYQGMGIGKKLYTETFEALWKQNYHVLTALVKDDNVGSWKPFLDNGFRRVSVCRIIKEIGISGFLKHYLTTPYLIAVGMDFYMCSRENTLEEKGNAPLQLFLYFFVNYLLLFPLWARWYHRNADSFLWSFLAYGTILAMFIGGRYLGKLISRNGGKFRFNQGGSFLLPLLPGPYFQALGRLSCPFLIFIMIPVYPFEVFGGGRKCVWMYM